MKRARTERPSRAGLAILGLAIGFSLIAGVRALPAFQHLPLLTSRISLCDRDYNAGGPARTLADVTAEGGPVVLVEPGLFGLLPSCPGPDDQGLRPCTREAAAGPCATVVYVRVGEDAYQGFSLSGGP
jgi:hypothetical protein